MFRGAHTFTDLMDGGEGIASNILTDRLQKLVARKIVDKVRMATDRRKYFYRLTGKGIDLAPALLELILWGDHYEGSDAPAAVIREMKSRRDGFLLKIRKQWEKDRKLLDAETSDD